ncbi:MAG: hypothetical protein KDI65_02755 [Alphaproteobacteria bacterium]|nr:hypothetical protein [Alphaproteobacteria bacterium]
MSTEQDDFQVSLERRLKVQRNPDSIVDIIIQIGYPKWTEPDIEARCPVAIRGDLGRVSDIAGIDPIDAMKNALTFVETYLKQKDSQTKVLWPDGESYF